MKKLLAAAALTCAAIFMTGCSGTPQESPATPSPTAVQDECAPGSDASDTVPGC
ncbi:hypothetical protein [Actinobaculum suis]|uniref:Secreted protein n=1 Tax=Actinobaculum suis TaxID=1657 RepID=A0AAW9HUD0_9ACTO|nr:hypothetical protein [Actinobaculum suis]MDY5153709.1 hypothetical protein [Actinobaculum suis]